MDTLRTAHHPPRKTVEQSSGKGHRFSVQNPVSPQFSCVSQTCGLPSLCLTFSNGKMEGGMGIYSQSWFLLFLLQLIHGFLTCPESQPLVSTGPGPTPMHPSISVYSPAHPTLSLHPHPPCSWRAYWEPSAPTLVPCCHQNSRGFLWPLR